MLMVYEKSQILNWVDGDTVDIIVDLGFFVKITVRVRLKDINTPERGQPGFKEATDYVKQQWPAGTHIKTECHGRDRYGRWVAKLYTNNPELTNTGIYINQNIVDAGLAVPDIIQ